VLPQNVFISVVITDASVIINLCHTGHILLLGRTTTFEFVVTDEVIAEVTQPDQQRTLAEAPYRRGVAQRFDFITRGTGFFCRTVPDSW
jgi:hypothetical protein